MPEGSFVTESIEIINPDFPRGDFRAAIFDFDGTLSLLRRNWQDVMIPMMVDIVAATGTSETREQLDEHVEEYVMRLNGRQTIYQMMRLAEEVALGLERLRPEYRMAFVLFHENELSYEEIAAAVDRPLGTVKTWIHRARRELIQHLVDREVVTESCNAVRSV